jgi:predicted nuclease of predicted toxin-antitoxin system
VKVLVDMNLAPRLVDYLNAAGVPAVHWSTVGRIDAHDTEIMAHASEHDHVVVTHDLDFSAILAATNATKPSVIQIRADNLSTAVIGAALKATIQQMTSELTTGALVTIDPVPSRLTLLPLRGHKL